VQLRAEAPRKLGASMTHCLEERRPLLEGEPPRVEDLQEGVVETQPGLSPQPASLQSLLAETAVKFPALR